MFTYNYMIDVGNEKVFTYNYMIDVGNEKVFHTIT